MRFKHNSHKIRGRGERVLVKAYTPSYAQHTIPRTTTAEQTAVDPSSNILPPGCSSCRVPFPFSFFLSFFFLPSLFLSLPSFSVFPFPFPFSFVLSFRQGRFPFVSCIAFFDFLFASLPSLVVDYVILQFRLGATVHLLRAPCEPEVCVFPLRAVLRSWRWFCSFFSSLPSLLKDLPYVRKCNDSLVVNMMAKKNIFFPDRVVPGSTCSLPDKQYVHVIYGGTIHYTRCLSITRILFGMQEYGVTPCSSGSMEVILGSTMG